MDRVRAAVQIFDLQKPPIIAGNDRIPGLRAWFHDLSMAIFPADHSVLADESRVGKRYGKGELYTCTCRNCTADSRILQSSNRKIRGLRMS